MSYSIYIGNAELDTDIESLRARYIVKEIEHPCAPEFPGKGDISGKTNGRHPSYTGMTHFARETGLAPLFLDFLLAQHPGICRLTNEHRLAVSAARQRWENAHPGAQPGWREGIDDATLARLIWYEWWIKWALENCTNPAICNW